MSIIAKAITASKISAKAITANYIQVVESCRYFSEFNGVSSYVELKNNIVLNSDWKISASLKKDQLGTMVVIGDMDGNSFLRIDGSGRVILRDSAGSQYQTDILLTDTAMHLYEFIFTFSTKQFQVYIDNALVNTKTFAGINGMDFDVIGKRGANFDLWEGIMSSIVIEDSGVEILNIPMDESNYEGDGTVDYINTVTGLSGATGYNINLIEVC